MRGLMSVLVVVLVVLIVSIGLPLPGESIVTTEDQVMGVSVGGVDAYKVNYTATAVQMLDSNSVPMALLKGRNATPEEIKKAYEKAGFAKVSVTKIDF